MWQFLTFPTTQPTVLIDLPGHGSSIDEKFASSSITEMAQHVSHVIDELGLEAYNLIGHSMGGYVGLELKANDARCKKVLLLNSNFWADSLQRAKERKRIAKIVQTNKAHFIYEAIPNLFLNPEKEDSNVKKMIREALNIPASAIANASIAMSRRVNRTELIRNYAQDIMIIQGREDKIVPVSVMRENIRGIDLKYIELQTVGHMAHIDAMDEVSDFIIEFCA